MILAGACPRQCRMWQQFLTFPLFLFSLPDVYKWASKLGSRSLSLGWPFWSPLLSPLSRLRSTPRSPLHQTSSESTLYYFWTSRLSRIRLCGQPSLSLWVPSSFRKTAPLPFPSTEQTSALEAQTFRSKSCFWSLLAFHTHLNSITGFDESYSGRCSFLQLAPSLHRPISVSLATPQQGAE